MPSTRIIYTGADKKLQIGRRQGAGGIGAFNAPAVWPLGVDGALLINGTTFNLASGSVKDYSSITIINGGILNIVGSDAAWVVLGCHGACTIDATSRVQYYGFDSVLIAYPTSGPFTKTAPNGKALSYSLTMGGGGNGGNGHPGNPPVFSSLGGLAAYGNGGGGAASQTGGHDQSDGRDAILLEGGQGGDGDQTGAAGAVTLGASGDSAPPDFFGSPDGSYGPGGGGGYRGYAGGGIYFKILGVFTLLGTIDVSGGAGGPGGSGADAIDSPQAFGGSGGGGGSGGPAGSIVLDYNEAIGPDPFTLNGIFCLIGGGFDSPGGNGGHGQHADTSTDADTGDGIQGDPGSFGIPGVLLVNDVDLS